jgi:bacterioferritin-associated ferredoxin
MIQWTYGSLGGPLMAMICHCAGVRESAIVRSIRDGATSIDDLRLFCGAAADCGGCEASLHELIDQHACGHSRESRVTVRAATAPHLAFLG